MSERRPLQPHGAPVSRRGRDLVDDWEDDPWDDPVEIYEDEFERPPRRPGGLKYLVFGGGAVGIVGLLIAFGVGIWVMRQLNPPGDPEAAVTFDVQPDDTLESVADRLEAQGIVTDARVFEEYVERRGGLTLVPGRHEIEPRDTMGNIQAALSRSPDETFEKVTFPEGYTLGQMDARLHEKAPHIPAGALVEAGYSGQVRSRYQPDDQPNPEGLAFPDTYEIGGNEDALSVYKRMVNVMDRVAGQEGIEETSAAFGYTPYQILVIASLIEREAGPFDEDRAKIARVIYNRLGLNVQLQVDATLYYAQDPATPFSQLKEIDSPYNTYKYKGLPPTLIASPSRASIRAALNPAPNPTSCKPPSDPNDIAPRNGCYWLYYVRSDAEGHHAFATNLTDHQANIAQAQAAGVLG